MQPENIPPYQPQQPVIKKKSIVMPIILMAWPASALIISILLYALFNLILNATPSSNEDLFSQPSVIETILNVTLFLVGTASVIVGPISFIIGLILLIQRKSK